MFQKGDLCRTISDDSYYAKRIVAAVKVPSEYLNEGIAPKTKLCILIEKVSIDTKSHDSIGTWKVLLDNSVSLRTEDDLEKVNVRDN